MGFLLIAGVVIICLGFLTYNEYQKGFHEKKDDTQDLIGKKYARPLSAKLSSEYGFPETLDGTDNKHWVGYFPDGDFTIITNKKTNNIVSVSKGREPL